MNAAVRALPLLLLASCAVSPRHVRITRPAPETPEEACLTRALSAVYVLVEPSREESSPPPDGLLARLAQKALEEKAPDVDASELACEIGRALGRTGASPVFRVRPEAPDPYPELLKPSALLRVRPAPLDFEKRRSLQSKETRDAEGKKTRTSEWVWTISAKLAVEGELQDQDGTLLARFSESASASRQSAEEPDAAKWFKKQGRGLVQEAARRVAARLAPRSRTRARPLFFDEDDPESRRAYESAHGGRWAAAESFWRERAASRPGRWRELWNLGVAAERSGRPAEARARYAEALDLGPESAELKKIKREELWADLPEGEGARPESPWFSRRVAVLPFSDETNSVDGPDIARKLVHHALESGGYSALPLEWTDEVLRSKGYTLGGQLKAAKETDLARWLDADLLLFGHLDSYQSVPARLVSGELSLWDAGRKERTWSSRAWAAQEEASLEALSVFKRSAGESWSKAVWLPAAETLLFVRRALRDLPQKASRE